MFNIMLDPLPTDWEGFPIDTHFRIGIQMCQVMDDRELTDMERYGMVSNLFFPGIRPDVSGQREAIKWFLTAWNHDRNRKAKDTAREMDYDIDQWRIYSAFRNQYGIDLNTADMHYWQFMGMLTTLDECAFTRVIDIRTKKTNPKMSQAEKKAIAEVKAVYALEQREEKVSAEDKQKQQEALRVFEEMRKAKP